MHSLAGVASSCALATHLQQNVNMSSSFLCSSPVKVQKVHRLDTGMQAKRFGVMNAQKAATDMDRSVQGDPSTPLTFQGEERCAEQGIRCYVTEKGEVTCEGFDEGPHFHPIARAQQRTVMRNAEHMEHLTKGISQAPSTNRSELSVYNVVEEGRGETYCEGKDES